MSAGLPCFCSVLIALCAAKVPDGLLLGSWGVVVCECAWGPRTPAVAQGTWDMGGKGKCRLCVGNFLDSSAASTSPSGHRQTPTLSLTLRTRPLFLLLLLLLLTRAVSPVASDAGCGRGPVPGTRSGHDRTTSHSTIEPTLTILTTHHSPPCHAASIHSMHGGGARFQLCARQARPSEAKSGQASRIAQGPEWPRAGVAVRGILSGGRKCSCGHDGLDHLETPPDPASPLHRKPHAKIG